MPQLYVLGYCEISPWEINSFSKCRENYVFKATKLKIRWLWLWEILWRHKYQSLLTLGTAAWLFPIAEFHTLSLFVLTEKKKKTKLKNLKPRRGSGIIWVHLVSKFRSSDSWSYSYAISWCFLNCWTEATLKGWEAKILQYGMKLGGNRGWWGMTVKFEINFLSFHFMLNVL